MSSALLNTVAVQAVERALAILERLDQANGEGLALADLARGLGLKQPTVHNLLQTLSAAGYAAQEPGSRRYQLGPRAWRLGRLRFLPEALARAAEPAVDRLQRQFNETVVLALYHRGQRQTLLSSESSQPLRVGASAGSDLHFANTATGRVMLGLLPEAERAALIGDDEPADLRDELARLAADGHARYWSPRLNVVALAVPVPSNELVAALGLYLPDTRFAEGRAPELLGALREAAADIAVAFERT